MTASLPLPPVVDHFDHSPLLCLMFQELAQVSAIDHLLLLDCVSGTTNTSTCEIPNLLFNVRLHYCDATHGIAKVFLSVCLSNACFVTERKKLVTTFLYHINDHLS